MSRSPTHSLRPARSFARTAFCFLAVFFALQFGWETLRGTPVETVVIDYATIRPAVLLINVLTPNVGATAAGPRIRAPGGGLNVRNGCEGMEALFLLVAALAIAPIHWRARGIGLLWGIGLVYVVNQARVLTLFYAYRSDPSLFDLLHAMVMPIAVMLIIAMYFYAWIIRSSRSAAITA